MEVMGGLRLCYIVLVCLFTQLAASAGEFTKATNTVGYANCFGNLQFTSHLGAVELSRGEVYDFYYQYSSHSGHNSPHLGKGFFVPMLEARLIDHDYFLEATTLGGAIVYMYRLPADPDTYVSLNGKNKAKKLGDDSYLRESEEGFQLEYRLGRIEKVITPKGTTLHFDYDGDFCRSIRSSTGSVVCALDRASEKNAVFSTARGRYKLKYQVHPTSRDREVNPEGEDEYTLEEIEWPSGAKSRFVYDDLRDEQLLKLSMKYEDSGMDFVWDRYSEVLQLADQVEYSISPLRRDVDYEAERRETGVYRIRRTFPDGTWENFLHDEDGGYSDIDYSRGERIRTHYINARGPVFNLVRKRERVFRNDGGEEKKEVFYEAFYDTEGKLLREVQEKKVTWHLRSGGLEESVVQERDNFVRYDQEGRVYLSRFDDAVTRTKWLSNGTRRVVSTYPWGEVHLRYYDDGGNFLPMPGSEKFPERNLP